MKLQVSNDWIIDKNGDIIITQSFTPATTADLVSALTEEGGEIVLWCDEHERPSPNSVTYCNIEIAKHPHFQPACRIAEHLIFRIPSEDKDT